MDTPTPIVVPGSEGVTRPALASLRRGAKLGRYVVLDRIGAGGMGAVYAAYDPQLDRRVALKVLHDEARGELAEARLLREAQAMASLSHPHVIAVHDVGVDGGRVFVAMELIDGQTLSVWLRSQSPDAAAILQVCIDAGRGLAAAHHAGLVHRDFKPDNVMVAADGRVLVMDFGLAGEPRATDSSSDDAGLDSTSHRLTRTGALLGTPAYMAPEQMRAQPVDARSDQFSYCVAVWEALFGSRPFRGSTVAAVRRSIAAGTIEEPPAGHGTPPRVVAALRKGLSIDPNDRHESMEALLDAFAVGRRELRLNAIVAAVGALSVLGAVGAALYDPATPSCDASQQHVGRVWDEARVGRLESAFERSGIPLAATRWTATRDRFEAWLATWSVAHTAVCEATHVHHEQTAAALERRMDCLQDAMLRADATLDELATADADLVLRASALTDDLPDPRDCRTADADPDAIADETPEQRAAVARAQRARAVAAARSSVGRYVGMLRASDDGLAALDGVAAPALRLDLIDHRARGLRWLGRTDEAVTTLDEGLRIAQRAGLADAEASLWLTLIETRGVAMADTRTALALLLPARLAIERADSPQRRIALEDLAGRVRFEDGQTTAALAHFAEALAIIEDEGARPGVAANVHNDYAVALTRLGRPDEALVHHRRAAEGMSERWGSDHPFVASALMNVGRVHEAKGEVAEARDLYEQALHIREQILGAEHPDTADVLINLGTLAADLGERVEGRAILERAYAIYTRTLPPRHPRLGIVLDNLAMIARADGRLDDALEACEGGLAILRERFGPEHPDVLAARTTRASILADLGRHAEALAIYRDVIADQERGLGPDHLDIAFPLMGLSQSAAAIGDTAEAVDAAQRALTVMERSVVEPRWLATAQFILASAQRLEGSDLAAARALATRARRTIAEDGPTPEPELAAEIDRWLAEG